MRTASALPGWRDVGVRGGGEEGFAERGSAGRWQAGTAHPADAAQVASPPPLPAPPPPLLPRRAPTAVPRRGNRGHRSMAAPFLADAAVCRWLFLKDMGAADAEVLRCPAALAAAHLHTIRRVADCCNGGDPPRVDWSAAAGGSRSGSCAGGNPPGAATLPTSVVGGPVVADLRLVSRHINGFLVGIAVNAVVPPGEGERDGGEAANDGLTLMSPPQTLSRRWAAHCPTEGKVVLIEFGWMRDDNHAMVRLFTWTHGRRGSGVNVTTPVASFQGTVLTHAGARPGKLPPADIVARVSFEERSCSSCESLAAASSAGTTTPGADGACVGACASGCALPQGSVAAHVPTVSARKANVELSRCTDEVTESALSSTRHAGVGGIGFGGGFVGSGVGSVVGSGISSLVRTLSSNGSHTLSTSTSSGVRAVGSSGPQPLTTRVFVDIIASASVSCATITSTGAPSGGGAQSSSGSAVSTRLSNWEPQKRSLVVCHSAVDWRTPNLVSPALRALLSPLMEGPEVDRLLNEASSLFRTQHGRRPAGVDIPFSGSHERPPRWESAVAAPPRPRYSPRPPTSRSLDGGAASDGQGASGVSREAPLPSQGDPSRDVPPSQQTPMLFPAFGLPRSSGSKSGTVHVQPLLGQGVGGPPWPDLAGASPHSEVPVSPGVGMSSRQRRPSSLPPLLPVLSPSGTLDWRHPGAGTSPQAPPSGAHLSMGVPVGSSGSSRRLGAGASPGQVRATPSSTAPPHMSSVPPGVQVAERPLPLPLSAMQQASPYGPGSFGGVPVSPVGSGISPMSLAGMGVPLRGHGTAGSAVSPMSLSPVNPLVGGMPALPGGDHRGPLPSDGTPYGSVYGPPLGAAAAASDPRSLSTAHAPLLPPSGKAGGFRMRPSVVPPSGANAFSPPAFVLPRVWSSATNPAAGLPGATAGVVQSTLQPQAMLPMGANASHAEARDVAGASLPVGHPDPSLGGSFPASSLGGSYPEPPLPGHNGGAQAPMTSHAGARKLPTDDAEGLYPAAKRARISSPSTLSVPIPCDICGRNFATRGDRNRHQRTVHEKARRHPCTVPGCTAAFSESSHVRTHMRTVHERRRDFVCNICNTALSTRSVLAKHKRNVHDDYRPYQCTLCELRFSQRCDLVRHSRRAHSTSAPADGRLAADAADGTGGGAEPDGSALLPGAPSAGGVPSSAAPPRVY